MPAHSHIMATYRPDPFRFLTGRLSENSCPSDVTEPGQGGKFDHSGAVLPWPGNTFICHINPQSDAHEAMVGVQQTLKRETGAGMFTFLPPSSFHMTVFQGISGTYTDGSAWPADIPTHFGINEVSSVLKDRISTTNLPDSYRIKPVDIFAGHSITVDGLDRAQELSLRQTRELLRDTTRISHKNFETYTFHITLGYLLRWLDDEEAQHVIELSQSLSATLKNLSPEIDLGPPEFCEFENMYHFEPVI